MGVTPREVLGFEEAAAFLGISTKTFAKVLKSEDLPGRKVGREWRFSKKALLEWLAAGRTREYQDDDASAEAERKPLIHYVTKIAKRTAQPRENITIEEFSADED
ncbi:MAG: helix-turn-helix domain-containing protein [Planctomycetes bacterium]|nr:helix-turn-helix domain-containing protein [Planctomycetota bacterium]